MSDNGRNRLGFPTLRLAVTITSKNEYNYGMPERINRLLCKCVFSAFR